MNRKQSGRSATFDENLTDTMPRRFGRDHSDVDAGGNLNRAVTDVEAVRKHQHLSGGKIWGNVAFVNPWLRRVWRENHDHVAPCSSVRNRIHREVCCDCLLARAAFAVQSDADITTAITQI